ncbi:SDR family NAD(P)-dependent oxidoreductase [Halomarina ordinaria]|uniref:SDR family NAD(P)-dependent oxidoreductase n=1 Tax=Halomarina ordinaria TaxID=3033939 RepID=A0ABD5U920_9EURY|nr:SDR family NAD(P)-dependent oxidoreductase [Halomarina sp. PSRA2]
MRLEDATVFVTGAGAGIGEATARRCAEEGATVIVTDVNEETASETADAIEDAGGRAVSHTLDVTDGERFHDLVTATAEEYGLDGIVNNAGTGHPPAYTEDLDAGVLEFVLDVNVRGVWHGCRAALPVMKEQGHGAIVNVASLAAILGLPRQAVYSLTKGAVLNFTRAVAAEAGPTGVRANAVCPGFIDTDLGRQYFESRDDPETARARMEAQYPLKRLGEADEIADVALFLLSEESSYVTGHGLVVDGGYSVS